MRDTGVGIPPEMLERLFEPFAQADRSLDRSKGGLGLGLALAKGLVEMHGGELRAYSAGSGKGAEFTVMLPLAERHEGDAESTAERKPARPRRILIVEDNVDAADSLREVLQLYNQGVEVAYSGPEGLQKAREYRPDVVLCDIGLPGMDGYEVARALRADPALEHTALVAVTGYALPEDLRRAEDAGFDRHVAKPPSIEKLEEVLGGFSR